MASTVYAVMVKPILGKISDVDSLWDLITPDTIGQWAVVIGSILTILYGVWKNLNEKRQGNQTVYKNGYEQIKSELERSNATLAVAKKNEDKFFILRRLCLETEWGQAQVIEAERIADLTESFEPKK